MNNAEKQLSQTSAHKRNNTRAKQHHGKTFWTRGVFLSFWSSATTPLISIPALAMVYHPENLTTQNQKYSPKMQYIYGKINVDKLKNVSRQHAER